MKKYLSNLFVSCVYNPTPYFVTWLMAGLYVYVFTDDVFPVLFGMAAVWIGLRYSNRK